MLYIGVREARRRFSELLSRCERGEEIVILRRGRVVSRLVPPERPAAGAAFPSMAAFRHRIGRQGTSFAALQRQDRDAR